MTRERAKELLPIIKAYAEGKTIQYLKKGEWFDALFGPSFSLPANTYRIKPEPKYRPFKNQEECFDEMMKHQPFGWFRSTYTKNLFNIVCLNDVGIKTTNTLSKYMDSYDRAFDNIKFVDGTPFGIKE